MSRGRPPKDPDARAGHGSAAEPAEVAIVPAELAIARPPEDLAPLAAEVWQICVTDMAALGHLRDPDLIQVRNYAVEVAIAIECEAVIAEHGAMMKEPVLAWSDELGANEVVAWKLKKNPACQLHREASNAVRLMAADLALTPIARIRGNLMSAVTASVAMSIKTDLERDVIDAEKAERAAKRRKSAAPKAKTKAAARKPARKRS